MLPRCSRKSGILLAKATYCQTKEVGPCELGSLDGPSMPSLQEFLCWTSAWESKYSSQSPYLHQKPETELFISICVSVGGETLEERGWQQCGTCLKTQCISG